MQSQDSIFRPEIKKIIFPKIYDIENLPVDKNLEPVVVISPIINKVSSVKKFQISFNLQVTNLTADVFLYLNGRKLDMYYSIPSGRYSLEWLKPETGEALEKRTVEHTGKIMELGPSPIRIATGTAAKASGEVAA